MASQNNGKNSKKPNIPKSIIVIYVLMIIVLLGICAGVFIYLFTHLGEENSESSNSIGSSTIDFSSSTSTTTNSSTARSSTESTVFSSDSSDDRSSTDSSAESTSSIDFVPGEILPENFNKEFFADDLFIGDSIFTGLYLYNYLDEKNVAAMVGYTPYGAVNTAIEAKGMSALEYAKQEQPKRIFIMLGSNAMSGGGTSGLEGSYRELINKLMTACPEAKICCISITPTARENSYPNIDNNEVREVNKIIKKMCSELGLEFCDLYTMISDEDGYFRDDYAEVDGMHFVSRTYAVLLSELQKIMS